MAESFHRLPNELRGDESVDLFYQLHQAIKEYRSTNEGKLRLSRAKIFVSMLNQLMVFREMNKNQNGIDSPVLSQTEFDEWRHPLGVHRAECQ